MLASLPLCREAYRRIGARERACRRRVPERALSQVPLLAARQAFPEGTSDIRHPLSPQRPICRAIAEYRVCSQWTPLSFRIGLTAFLQHIGGIHSGCAASGVAWFIFAVVRNFQHHAVNHIPKVVLAWGVITVSFTGLTMIAAAPWIRHYHHK